MLEKGPNDKALWYSGGPWPSSVLSLSLDNQDPSAEGCFPERYPDPGSLQTFYELHINKIQIVPLNSGFCERSAFLPTAITFSVTDLIPNNLQIICVRQHVNYAFLQCIQTNYCPGTKSNSFPFNISTNHHYGLYFRSKAIVFCFSSTPLHRTTTIIIIKKRRKRNLTITFYVKKLHPKSNNLTSPYPWFF